MYGIYRSLCVCLTLSFYPHLARGDHGTDGIADLACDVVGVVVVLVVIVMAVLNMGDTGNKHERDSCRVEEAMKEWRRRSGGAEGRKEEREKRTRRREEVSLPLVSYRQLQSRAHA